MGDPGSAPPPNIMKPIEEYEFHLEAYTPATIPMERLAAYLNALAELLGQTAHVHFADLEGGSTSPIIKVDTEAAPKVAKRLALVGEDSPTFAKINRLCEADNASAQLFSRVGDQRKGKILHFVGARQETDTYPAVDDPIVVDGQLIKIGGKDNTAHAAIQDSQGKVWNGEVSREEAAKMARFLYNGTLRVSGSAKWLRASDGKWEPKNVKFASFHPLEDESLSAVRKRLMALRDSDWGSLEDIDQTISKERG